VLVIVAATSATADAAEAALRLEGATVLRQRTVGPDRMLVTAGPFDDAKAALVVARMRGMGWPASDRPEGGGHLTAWNTHTAPVVVADRLWVCFPWCESDRSDAPPVVEIDPGAAVGPGAAFGTGSHPSTLLLLAELVARLHGGETVLDVGCGSGVLAIAAVRLGAATATAIDIAPAAVAATTANAAGNGVGGRVLASATPAEEVVGLFDVVLANIGAATLRTLGPALVRRLAPNGWLGVSGISPAQISTVAAALPGLAVVSAPILEDWAAIVARFDGVRSG
jgi:ribosomal protein L11 methyltransferase